MKPGVFCGRVFVGAVAFLIFMKMALALEITPQNVIDLANSDRREAGIGALAENEKLMKAAGDKADDMVKGGYFSHNSPEGINPWYWFEKENYDYNYAGENLAMDFNSSEKMNQAWLDSPTHRANILNEKFTEIGVAIKEGIVNGHETAVVVQLFGSGDKNAEKGVSDAEQESLIPKLPSATNAGNSGYAFSRPVITSPQNGEAVPEKDIEIVGRAKPGSKVYLSGDSAKDKEAVADAEGWFRVKLKGLSEGGHKLAIGKTVSGEALGAQDQRQELSFDVDQTKPRVGYHLHEGRNPQEYLLDISSSETNCSFEIGGERIESGSRKKIYATIPSDRLASAIKVRDGAGNKIIKEVNLANYFQGNKGGELVNRIANYISADSSIVAESGMDSLRKNLGIIELSYNY